MTIVARLLRGAPTELVGRETNVFVARLTEWRECALAGASSALKERDRDERDDEIARLKSKAGEITHHTPEPLGSQLDRRRRQSSYRLRTPSKIHSQPSATARSDPRDVSPIRLRLP